jgi:hypothetical protein
LPRVIRAQQNERMRRVGYFTADTGNPGNLLGIEQSVSVEGLRAYGWFDSRNVTLEHRYSGVGRERIRRAAAELVALGPDVIVSTGGLQLAALLDETRPSRSSSQMSAIRSPAGLSAASATPAEMPPGSAFTMRHWPANGCSC